MAKFRKGDIVSVNGVVNDTSCDEIWVEFETSTPGDAVQNRFNGDQLTLVKCRAISVGDKVIGRGTGRKGEVHAVHGTCCWTKFEGEPWPENVHMNDVTWVDD